MLSQMRRHTMRLYKRLNDNGDREYRGSKKWKLSAEELSLIQLAMWDIGFEVKPHGTPDKVHGCGQLAQHRNNRKAI